MFRIFLFAAALRCLAQVEAGQFAVYDIYLDPQGEPLAAFQLKISDKKGAIKIISVEGGEHPAFQKAPYFDPKAIQRDIVKLAAFQLSKAGDLPTGKTRVASLHVEIGPEMTPEIVITVEAAARPGGKRVLTEATIIKRITE